jgi:hypothetical protein
MVGRTSKQEDKGMAKESDHTSPPEDVSAIARLSDYTVHSDSPETWTAQDEPPEVAADYGKLGEHVTSVLEAANQAAATIRDEARTTAKDIVERAQREAGTWLEKARAETEEESREMKERANAYATEKRREADRQASALTARAKREASEQTKAAQERGAALAKNVELSEQRLRQLVGGLRDLAVRLEELLQAPAAGDGASAETPTSGESMEESLRRSAAAQGTSQPQ